jgi:hypothetical protein
MSGNKSCVTCNKGGILMLCDRCNQTYCDKHINEHRQQLAHQLTDIDHEYDLIQQEIRQSPNKHSLLKSIDKWEKESIVKIQTTAETVREELQQMVNDAKERLSTACRDIVENLRSSREIGEYCDNDLARAMQQLKQLRTKVVAPLSVHLVENKTSVIHLITIKGTDFKNEDLRKAKIYSITKRVLTSDIQENFFKVTGPVTITDGGLLIKHTGPNLTYAHILGEQLYSEGRQTIRFKIEQSQTPYKIFFGCVSSQINLDKIHSKSPFIAGWFGHNEVYQHGLCNTNMHMHGYDSNKIETDDVISLTFDCDQKQIELYPERTKKIHELSMDLDKIPLPWQLLVILTYENDCVKILYKV